MQRSGASDAAGLSHVQFLSLRSTGWVHGDRQTPWLTLLRSQWGPWGNGIALCDGYSALCPPDPGPNPGLDDKLHLHFGHRPAETMNESLGPSCRLLHRLPLAPGQGSTSSALCGRSLGEDQGLGVPSRGTLHCCFQPRDRSLLPCQSRCTSEPNRAPAGTAVLEGIVFGRLCFSWG